MTEKIGFSIVTFFKILIAVLCVLTLSVFIFVEVLHYFGGITFYMYYTQKVINSCIYLVLFAIIALGLLTLAIIAMFKSRYVIRVTSIILLIIFIPVAVFSSFVALLLSAFIGPYGCSYTEDIANYGVYDNQWSLPHFPNSITEDMTVVDFAYYYKYCDRDHKDFYLEVKFENQEIMERYLSEAIASFSENGTLEYQNPYNEKYTDIIRFATNTVVEFDCEDGVYSMVDYSCISYSYEELTIIYNYTSIGSDIFYGNDPEEGKYYPKLFERFGVEFDEKNNFNSKDA